MSSLFDLSKFMLSSVVSEWLNSEEVCLLDSAICNSTERNSFLRNLQNNKVSCSKLLKSLPMELYMQWIASRSLEARTLNVNSSCLKILCAEYGTHLVNLKVICLDGIAKNFDSESFGRIVIFGCYGKVCDEMLSIHYNSFPSLRTLILTISEFRVLEELPTGCFPQLEVLNCFLGEVGESDCPCELNNVRKMLTSRPA